MQTRNLSTRELETIAVEVLGPITWQAEGKGYFPCPGASMHTNKTGRRDCMVSLLPGSVGSGGGRTIIEIPTVSCFHDSCADIIAETNHKLRSAIGKAKVRGAEFGSSPTKSKKSAPQQSRTDRTDKITVRKGGSAKTAPFRTIRTLLPSSAHTRGTKSQNNKGELCNPSDRSEPEKLPPGGPATVAHFLTTQQDLPPGTVWVTSQGDVHQAQRTEHAITIGRRTAAEPITHSDD